MTSSLTDEEKALLNALADREAELERSSIRHHDELIRRNGEASKLLEDLQAAVCRSPQAVGFIRKNPRAGAAF